MRGNMRFRVVSAAILSFAGVPVLAVQAQHHGPPVGATEQPKQMQQHMEGMQDMMQRMGTMMQRSQQMSTQMSERMREMSSGPMIEQHRAMQQMSDHMTTASGHMNGLMGQMDAMMRDHELMQTPGVEKDLKDMRRQMGATMGSMEKMLQVMERMNKRLGGGTAGPPKP